MNDVVPRKAALGVKRTLSASWSIAPSVPAAAGGAVWIASWPAGKQSRSTSTVASAATEYDRDWQTGPGAGVTLTLTVVVWESACPSLARNVNWSGPV